MLWPRLFGRYFCKQTENAPHLLYTRCVAKTVWPMVAITFGANDIPNSPKKHGNGVKNGWLLARNFMLLVLLLYVGQSRKPRTKHVLTFEGKLIKNPVQILCHACALMRFWAGLYVGDDKEILIDGVNAMLKIAVELLTKPSKRSRIAKLI